VIRNKKLVNARWYDIKVGEIIKVSDKEYLPCDVIVLASSEPKGSCYIETKNLDGETNLKNKKAHKDLRFLNPDLDIDKCIENLSTNEIKF